MISNAPDQPDKTVLTLQDDRPVTGDEDGQRNDHVSRLGPDCHTVSARLALRRSGVATGSIEKKLTLEWQGSCLRTQSWIGHRSVRRGDHQSAMSEGGIHKKEDLRQEMYTAPGNSPRYSRESVFICSCSRWRSRCDVEGNQTKNACQLSHFSKLENAHMPMSAKKSA